MRNKSAKLILASILSFGPALSAAAQEHGDIGTPDAARAEKAFAAKPLYSPYAGRNFPTRPLFGDTHLHTGASFDAGTHARILNTPTELCAIAIARDD